MKKECNVCWMATLGGFAIAFVGFAVMIHGWPWAPTDFWEALGAMGAMSAAVAAVGIALSQHHKEKKSRAEEAEPIRYVIEPDLVRVAIHLGASYWIIVNFLLRRWDGEGPTLTSENRERLGFLNDAAEMKGCMAVFDRIHKLPVDEARAASIVLGKVHRCVTLNGVAAGLNRTESVYPYLRQTVIDGLPVYRELCGLLYKALSKSTDDRADQIRRALYDVWTHNFIPPAEGTEEEDADGLGH